MTPLRSRLTAAVGDARTSALGGRIVLLWRAEAFTLVIGIVQLAIVARLVTPRELGLASLAISYPSVVYAFLDPRASEATTRFFGAYWARGDDRKSLAAIRLSVGADAAFASISFVIVLASAGWVATQLLDEPTLRWLLVLTAASFIVRTPYGASQAVLGVTDRFRSMSRIRMGATVFRAALTISLAAAGMDAAGLVISSAVSSTLEALWSAVAARSAVRERTQALRRVRIADLGPDRRTMLRFLMATSVHRTLGALTKQLDTVIVGYLAGATQAGYLRVAKTGSGLVAAVVGPIQSVLYPRVSEARSAGEGLDLALATARRLTVPLALGAACTLPLVPAVIRVGMGDDYVPAARAAQWAIAAGLVWLAFAWLRPLALALGELRLLLVNASLVVSASLAGYFLVADDHGAAGITAVDLAVSGVLGHSILAVVVLRRARRDRDRTLPAASPDGAEPEPPDAAPASAGHEETDALVLGPDTYP